MRPFQLAAACFVIGLASTAWAEEPPPSAAELEALAARRAIKSAVVEIESKMFAPTGEVTWESTRKLWLSGDNRRQDWRQQRVAAPAPGEEDAPRAGKEPPKGRIVRPGDPKRILTCYSGGDFIHWTELPDGVPPVALNLRKGEAGKEFKGETPLDPRWLGMAPIDVGNLLHYGAVDSLVGNPKRTKVTETKDTWEGKPAVRVRFEHTKVGTAMIEVWIVPEWGHSVVRVSESDDKEKVEQWVENKVALDKSSKLWFPISCVVGRTKEGKKTREEESTITVKSLNEPVDPKVFELAGMDLPVGTPVINFAEGGSYVWNGKELVRAERPRATTVEGPRGLSSGFTLLLTPEVRAELKLTNAQSEKLNEMKGPFRIPPEELGPKREKELKQLLDEKQQGRLWELILQQEGGRAIQWPNVADRLKLDEPQLERIKKIRADNIVKRTPLDGLSPEEREKVLSEARKLRDKVKAEILTVLTAEQTEIFQKMQGAKFTFPEPRRP